MTKPPGRERHREASGGSYGPELRVSLRLASKLGPGSKSGQDSRPRSGRRAQSESPVQASDSDTARTVTTVPSHSVVLLAQAPHPIRPPRSESGCHFDLVLSNALLLIGGQRRLCPFAKSDGFRIVLICHNERDTMADLLCGSVI